MNVRLNDACWGYYEHDSSEDKKNCLAGAKDSYDEFEYNCRSSRASAAFLKYHLYEFCRQNAPHRVGVRTWAKTPPNDNDAKNHTLHSTVDIADDEFKDARDTYDKAV